MPHELHLFDKFVVVVLIKDFNFEKYFVDEFQILASTIFLKELNFGFLD